MSGTAERPSAPGPDLMRFLVAVADIDLNQLGQLDPGQLRRALVDVIEGRDTIAAARGVVIDHLEAARSWTALLERLAQRFEPIHPEFTVEEEGESFLQGLADMDAGAALDEWVNFFGHALATWDLDLCEALVENRPPFLDRHPGIVRRCRAGVAGLRGDRPDQAIGMLEHLVEGLWRVERSARLPERIRSPLLILLGRIHLLSPQRSRYALGAFERARRTLSDDGRPAAGLGSYHRKLAQRRDGDERERHLRWAHALFHEAVRLSPGRPDGYVGLGLLAEDEELWSEADEWYRQAIEKLPGRENAMAALHKLLSPTSGRLLVQLARKCRERGDQQEALEAIDHALAVGIRGEGGERGYPERVAYRIRAKLLENLGRPAEAVPSYWEAGCRFAWREDHPVAQQLLEHACRLDPAHAESHWALADSRLVTSVDEAPPYLPDAGRLQLARESWEAGTRLARPDRVSSWVYLTGAMISEQEARLLPAADRWARWWEAVTYLERAILLDDQVATRFALLGRYYRMVGADAAALDATATALDLDAENLEAMEERAAALANIGAFAEAGNMIDRRLELGASPWVTALKGFVLLGEQQPAAAREPIEAAISEEPDNLWFRHQRARCQRMLDDFDGARQEYQAIVEAARTAPPDERDMLSGAAMWVGALDEAIDSLTEELGGPSEHRGATLVELGCCYLVKGDLNAAREHLLHGIEQARSVQGLKDLVATTLPDIGRFLLAPDQVQAAALLDKTAAMAAQRIDQLTEPRSAVDELSELALRRRAENQEHGQAWTGAYAGLARLLFVEGRWNEAAAAYRALLARPERFPEADIGLDRAALGLVADVDRRLAEGDEVDDRLLETSMDVVTATHDERLLGDLHARIGLAELERDRTDAARASLRRALAAYRRAGVDAPGARLGHQLGSLPGDVGRFWAMRAAWHRVAFDGAGLDADRDELTAARRAFDQQLARWAEADWLNRDAGVHSVLLDVSEKLVPPGDPWEWPIMTRLLPDMRARVESETGMRLSGMRMRMDAQLPADRYVILLSDVPVSSGQVRHGARFCAAPAAEALARGIPPEAVTAAHHPMTGADACWIDDPHGERAGSEGLPMWADPLQFVVVHLEAVLREHLAELLDFTAFEELLDHWAESDDDVDELIGKLLWTRRRRLDFARVLRGLVVEHVPLTRTREILETASNAGLADGEVDRAVRAVRMLLRQELPGNDGHTTLLPVPADLEHRVARWTNDRLGRDVVVLPGEETQDLLGALHRLYRSAKEPTALVTESSELRPIIRRMLATKVPTVRVLARSEVLAVQPEASAVAEGIKVGKSEDGHGP